MNDELNLFNWPNVQIEHFYAYIAVAALVAFYLIYKSDSKHKIEIFFISFYLLTGSYNNLLIFKIPGFSFFEIQPLRFIYLMLLLLIVRKSFGSNQRVLNTSKGRIPWFEIALILYVFFLSLSIVVNIFPSGIKTILDSIAFIIIFKGLKTMACVPSYNLIGKSILIGAVASSIISVVQLSISPYFLRIGWDRDAFGDVLRSNGLFSTEYYNAYYLIVAITWALIQVKNKNLKFLLVCLYSVGVLTTFLRMGWLILAIVLITYLVYIRKTAIEKLALIGISGLTLVLSLSIFFYQDIMNSSVVKERLSDNVNARKGYYEMVFDNYDKRPLLGYGDHNNEVYYSSMLRVTKNRDRATGATGGIHNGFLTVLFFYGIPALVAFSFFTVLTIIYYAKSLNTNNYYVIPFLVSIIFLVSNLTNTFLFLSYISVLLAIHIGIGMGMRDTDELLDS